MPERPRVKICGLREPAHAELAEALDVWAIGLVFASGSPRLTDVGRAREVAAAAGRAERVGVFVEQTADEIAEIAGAVGLTLVQLHGQADVAATRAACGLPVVAGFAIAGSDDLARAGRSDADLVLLDAAVPGQHGGTGMRADWGLVAGSGLTRPFLLAGGLDADNVGEALATVAPWGVDVSSGVESSRGVKDPGRITAFVAAVNEAVAARSVG